MTNNCHVALQHIELEKPASDDKLLSSQQDLYRRSDYGHQHRLNCANLHCTRTVVQHVESMCCKL